MLCALAGGVGGAKLAHGLSRILPPEDLAIVVNVGDDFEHLGLHVSPDIDTVVYTLAGIANPETGWGVAGETWSFMDALGALGGETWFRLGDRDLATHVERTRLLVHLIDTSDASEADPIHSFEVISGELQAFSDSLAEKPLIVVATKLDATTNRTRLDALREFCRERGLEFHAISAATGEGVRELARSIADALDKIPKAAPEPVAEVERASHENPGHTSPARFENL